jgi:hypothetical protein
MMITTKKNSPAGQKNGKWLQGFQEVGRVGRSPRLSVARWYIIKPKKTIWVNFTKSSMEDVGIFYGHNGLFYGHLVYFVVILDIDGYLVYFPPFWYVVKRKIWQPCRSSGPPKKP